jgi:hypothetical protein
LLPAFDSGEHAFGIGSLTRRGTPHNDPFREEFVRGMPDLGYVEGRNIAYEFRHYGDDVESIPSLIATCCGRRSISS